VVKLVDTHCHLYSEEFNEDRTSAVAKSIEMGVNRVLLPNIDMDSIGVMHDLEDQYPENCFSMMGLHPCYVKEDFKKDLEVMYAWFDKRKYVGVGETGMDLYWDKSTQAWQEESLNIQIEWAIEKGLAMSLHTRNATQEVIKVLKPYKGKVQGVFHCFSESKELADEIIKLGFYLGIGGVVTFKNAGIAQVVAELGIEKLVLETDSPYLAPVPYRGKRNEPSYTRYVAENVADVTGESLLKVAEATSRNAEQLFGV
jgi:TatD DNase family protein